MTLTFENLGTNTYLVYEINEADELDSMSLGMLTNNTIPGFAPASFTQMDMSKYIKYNVSAKVSVKQLFSGPVNKKRLLGVFSGVVEAMLSAEDYMLDPGSVLLDTDYIFADVTSCEAELVCLPVINLQTTNPDLATFFKNILFTTQFDQTENCDHVAQLINYLNTHPTLQLEEFKGVLHTLSHGPVTATPATPVPQTEAQPVVQPATQAAVPQSESQPENQKSAQPVVQKTISPVQSTTSQKQPVVQKQAVEVPSAAGVQIPGAPAHNNNPAEPVLKDGEKPMSLIYLMQHYNKENAAIYKAQQEAAKQKKLSAAAPPAKPTAPSKPQPGPGIAIPGQTAPSFSASSQPTACTPAATATSGSAVSTKAPAATPVTPAPATQPAYRPEHQVQSTPLNFGETTVLGGGNMGETTVLSSVVETAKNDPHLIRSKNNEKIPLNKPVFRIGKERSYVDYFISDNTAISRGHANIVNHNGDFFVVDTNSTNHTYVNGIMIQSGVETKLSHGDKVRFANEEFSFMQY